MLARREHGVIDLLRKLLVNQFDPLLVDVAIQVLVRVFLVSVERFFESMINSRFNRGHGPIKVLFELSNKGVPEHIVDKTMAELSPDWHQSLADLIEKKYAGQLSRTPAERVKQVRFLSSRGFPHEMIYSVIQDAEFD